MSSDREKELWSFWQDLIGGRQPEARIAAQVADSIFAILDDPRHEARPLFGLDKKRGSPGRRKKRRK